MTSEMFRLVVGLGNPGIEYAFTRHNAGFLVADQFVRKHQVEFQKSHKAESVRFRLKNKHVIVLKPLSYMNLSGEVVARFLNELQLSPQFMIVICDDISLPFGSIRLRKKGGSGGHNGLQSIIDELQTENFNRLRIGIGNDFQKGEQSRYVLSEWDKDEQQHLPQIIQTAAEAVETFILEGIEHAMNKFNNRKVA